MDRGGADRERIHHLTAAGMIPAPMISETAAPPASIAERRECVCTVSGRRNPHGDARDDRQRPFRSDDQAEQIRSGRVGERAVDVHEIAVGITASTPIT
jgi:hypothetical protein